MLSKVAFAEKVSEWEELKAQEKELKARLERLEDAMKSEMERRELYLGRDNLF